MLNTKSYSHVGFDDQLYEIRAPHQSAVVKEELRAQHRELKEGFSTGSVAFWLTLLLTIGSGYATDAAAQFAASKVMPDISSLLDNPLLAKIAEKGEKAFMKVASKINVISSVVYMVTVTFAALLTIWVSNTITLTAVIYKECGRFDVSTAMRNAWAGAVPTTIFASIFVVVMFILSKFPITAVFATMFDATMGTTALIVIMVIFNLIFNAGVGQATSKSQGCAAKPTPTPPAATTPAATPPAK